ncbi:MAG: MotA/TolQ/ExbB proton channel family protein, partial [Bacteroidota bacterium]
MSQYRKSYAESSPEQLIWSPIFWWEEKQFITIIVIAIIILFIFWDFTYGEKNTATLIFNLIIHSFGILGVLAGIKFLAEIKVNTDIVIHVETKGDQILDKIKKQKIQNVTLDKLEGILPNQAQANSKNSDTQPAMIRLFQRIIKEAEDQQFESSVAVMHPYKDESYDELLQISNYQKLALRLGILGTFIGLIIAIKNLADNGISDDITELIKSLFSSLYLAFSTSVAGLEVAILLGFLLSILHRKQKKYFRKMEEAVLTMLSLARNVISKDEFSQELQKFKYKLDQFGDRLYDSCQSIDNDIRRSQQQISSLTTQIEQGLKQLSQSKTEFDGFLNKISGTQKQFITEMQQIYDVTSLKKMSDELQRNIIITGKSLGNRVENTEEKIELQTEKIQQGIDRLSQSYLEFSQFLEQIHSSQQNFI